MPPGERSVLPGTVELLVLRALQDGPAHGFGISRDLRKRSNGVVDIQDGALYQALHRMQNAGLLSAEWGRSQKGKRAKFYRLTEAGARKLASEATAWHRYASAVTRILGPDVGEERIGGTESAR